MRTHATAQLIGGRPRQCDRTAVVAAPGGVHAYALLDGVGSSVEVARWTRRAAQFTAAWANRDRDMAHDLFDALVAPGTDEAAEALADGIRALYDMAVASLRHKARQTDSDL